MQFQFATASQIEFGVGAIQSLPRHVSSLGSRVLIVSGKRPANSEIVLGLLENHATFSERFIVGQEPRLADIEQGVDLARCHGAQVIIGIGGGSVIDAAKAIAALTVNFGKASDYLEVVGAGLPLENPALPCIALPTTAGTGSEVTRNAVLGVPVAGVKVSLRHVSMLPRYAIVDPTLALSVPPRTTASTGCDALTQVIEPLVSRFANPLTDALCLDAIARAAQALPKACELGSDLGAREDMALVSLFGGLSLANAKLGAVHGFAGALGGTFHAPHGELCAALLAPTMAGNIRALLQRDPDSNALRRYREIACLLCQRASATAEDGVEWIRSLVERLQLPTLAMLGVEADHLDELVAMAQASSSMKGNPIELRPDELHAIVREAL